MQSLDVTFAAIDDDSAPREALQLRYLTVDANLVDDCVIVSPIVFCASNGVRIGEKTLRVVIKIIVI